MCRNDTHGNPCWRAKSGVVAILTDRVGIEHWGASHQGGQGQVLRPQGGQGQVLDTLVLGGGDGGREWHIKSVNSSYRSCGGLTRSVTLARGVC